jgi:spermidine/putrescine transport system permease protein
MKKNKVFRPTAFAFPYLAVTLVFVIVPLILVMYYAFRGEDGGISVENFVRVFSEEAYRMAFFRTIGIAFLSTATCLLIAYPVAYILSQSPFNKWAILALLFVVPMWMNFMLRILALNNLLSMLGVPKGLFASVIGLVYDFFPYMLLPIYTVLSNMDKSYLEASRDLGASDFRTFWRVTFPLSIPGIISGISMVFMPIFSSYAVTDMMGTMSTSIIGSKIAVLFTDSLTYGDGAALSFVLLLIVLITMFIGSLVSKRSTRPSKAGKAV